MFRPIAICLLIFSLCTTPVLAADKKPAPEEAPPIPAEVQIDPDQQAIADYWDTLTAEVVDPYLTPPSVVSPYLIGELNPAYTDTGLRYLNFVRWLSDLQQVTLSDHLCVQAQYGAVLLAANDVLTHTPEKPADMEASFYRMGANAAAASNLSMRFGFETATLLQSALQGHMDEDSPPNRLDLGHRRWLLDPRLGKVGFGLATSATEKQYIVVPVTDASGESSIPELLLWPNAGQFPNNVFAPGTPWSIHLDENTFATPVESQLQVTVTRHRDGKVFVPSVLDGQAQLSAEGSYLLVSTKEYGSGYCVSFSIGKTALGENTYLGDYTVQVTGLYTKRGQAAPLEYTVRFFDAENLSQPSAWALEEVQDAARLELLPEDLTDFYQQPITRLEYCRLTMQILRQKTGLTTEALVEQYALPGPRPVFSDCKDPEVLAAAAIGAVFGPGDGTFRPQGLISRQDAAVMLLQAAATVGAEVLPIDGLMYADADQISTYARLAIQWTSQVRDSVTGKPVMAGVGGGRFDPLGNYTREQAMLTALRLFRS